MKIVINTCHGGFHPSDKVMKLFPGKQYWEIPRDHPTLVEAVERDMEGSSSFVSNLKVVEIPDGTDWVIEEYDGKEWVSEKHMTWD